MGILSRIFGTSQPRALLPLEPVNELERRLHAVIFAHSSVDPFVEELLRAQVFVLLHGVPGVGQVPPAPMRPLALKSSKGYPCVCVFTAPERALPSQTAHPEYGAGLLVAFTWVLQAAPPDLGLIVNPGWAVSIELPSEGVGRLRRDLAAASPGGAA